MNTNRAVDAKREQHEEEDNGPHRCVRHHADGLWVRDKDETRTRLHYFLNRFALHERHVAKCREDDKTRQNTRETVYETSQ